MRIVICIFIFFHFVLPLVSLTPNITVDKQGSANFQTISDAISAAPSHSLSRFVIYVKEGVYSEYVTVPQEKTNIALIGDGIGKTIVTGNRSNSFGWSIIAGGTMIVLGDGFMAQGITIENTAGPNNGQAVALRSNANTTVYYRCSFLGYQDTLFVDSFVQFFRECDIHGTIDFIFGDSAVVFQKCNIYLRKPLPGQGNTVTAQGRQGLELRTGISIHNCTITAAPDLKPVQSSFHSFLGRPWKKYSRTVIFQSVIDDVIDPTGWSKWNNKDFALDTLFYAEYQNIGVGANLSKRVKWPGYKIITDPNEVINFTVVAFIYGDQWIPSTGVPFDPNLI